MRVWEAIKVLSHWLYRIVLALSQAINSILGGNSKFTVSAQIGYYILRDNQLAISIDKILSFIDFWHKGSHCLRAYKRDLVRMRYLTNTASIWYNRGMIGNRKNAIRY